MSESATASNGREIKYSVCYMCSCRCGIKVTLEDGKIRYIEGNPDYPVNKGVLCAKGSAGMMKQLSPARITSPLLRKEGSERGGSDFEQISWEQAYDIITERLQKIRETDPKKLAFFTGRDQMQALTSYWAKQFGTPNYAAHGGFCSVNVAAGMIYSLGGTCWEFGGPDWEHTKYLLMFGVAEDHDSNPFKIGIGKLKDNGGKLVVVNPVKSGYGAVADEWLPIRPGTDGALILALIHILLKNNLVDYKFLADNTNATHLLVLDEGGEDEGLFWQKDGPSDTDGQINFVFDKNSNSIKEFRSAGVDPAFEGIYTAEDGKRLTPAFALLKKRILEEYDPEKVSKITSIPRSQIERIGYELGVVARERISLPIEWTDAWGNHHKNVTGAPVSIHAMRGIAAHSNGFQTTRALSILMMILGIIDRPGGFRHKPPYPRPIPPCPKPINDPEMIQPNSPLPAPELGFPTKPENLMVTKDGQPVRIDKAYSWEYPLTAHGMIQNVIRNGYNADPYEIDTMIFFMANMAWNSSMNTAETIKMLTAKKEGSDQYKIPFIITSDAFFSEQVAYSDLVLPDTTYLERYDVISMLDRPISEYSAMVDAIRQPILTPPEGCVPFQESLIILANRLNLPGFCDEEGAPLFKSYQDFITNWQVAKDTPIGFLAGWRGENGDEHLIGKPNPRQWDLYKKNQCFFEFELENSLQWNRNTNQGYLNWAQSNKLIRENKPIIMKLYSEVLQRFRLAAKGQRAGRVPPDKFTKNRIIKYYDPIPFWYEPLEDLTVDTIKFDIHAITQRPMPMYHSWDSQNAWLRQIIGQNFLYMNPLKAEQLNLKNEDWVWVESAHGKIRAQIKLSNATQIDTVWTWNGIGKMSGAWNLDKDADEAKLGFLLNHLISEEIDNPDNPSKKIANADPITGQAGWYDLRVRIYKADQKETYPQFKSLKKPPGMKSSASRLLYNFFKKSAGGK